jgi:rfaE bifunctional protein nucleotidyltransferase chain/domain
MIKNKLDKNLKNKIQQLKRNKKKIGLVHGVFDVIHVGHLLYFEEAKKKVDFLIVSVTADLFAEKAPGKPLFKLDSRIKILKSLKLIDYVIESHSPTAVKVINEIKPDFYFKGKDYKNDKDLSGNLNKEIRAIKKVNGSFVITETKLSSSSEIINKKFDFLNDEAQIFLKNKPTKNLIEKIDTIKNLNKKILVIGDPVLDIYREVSPSGKSNKANVLSTRIIREKIYAGGALLVLNIMKNFVTDVTYAYCDNKNNNSYINKLLNKKIKKIKIKCKTNFIEKIRYIDDYYQTKLFQVTQNEENEIDKFSKKQFLNFIKNNYKKYDKIFVFDYGYYTVFEDILKFLNNNIPIRDKLIINCQSNSYNFGFNLPVKYKFGRIMAMDEIEFRLCCGNKKKDLKKLITENMNLFKNFKILLVTQGKTGCYIIFNKKLYFIPTLFKFSKDTIGCGDVFLSLFGLAMTTKNFDIVESALISHVAAGIHANNFGNENTLTEYKLLSTIKNIIKK